MVKKMFFKRIIKESGAYIKKHRLSLIIIFLISFSVSMFFTQGLSFFWEDSDYFDITILGDTNHFGIRTEQIKHNPPSELALKFASIFFSYDSLLDMGYMDRPLLSYMWDLLPNLFGDNILFYRLSRAVIFSLLVCLLFYFIRKETNFHLAVMGASIYMFYPEAWLAVAYNADGGIHMHLLTFLSLFLFYFYYYKNLVERDESCYSLKNILILLMILITCRISILIKNEGRIVFIIIALFILIKHFNDYRLIRKFIPLVSILTAISLPIAGIIMRLIDKTHMFYLPTGSERLPFFELVMVFFKRVMIPINTLGVFLFFVMIFCIIAVLFYSIKARYAKKDHTKKQKNDYDMILFSAIWFILVLGVVFMARQFDYPAKGFQKLDFVYILIPFILLACSSIYAFTNILRKNTKKKIFYFLMLILIFTMLQNIRNLNSFRGAWGEYFIGWDNTIDYISKNSENAVVLVPASNGFGSFYHPVDLIMTSDPNEIDYLRMLKRNYTEVYLVDVVGVAGRTPIIETSENIVLIKKIEVNDNSMYGKIKKLLKRKSKAEFWVYQYKE